MSFFRYVQISTYWGKGIFYALDYLVLSRHFSKPMYLIIW